MFLFARYLLKELFLTTFFFFFSFLFLLTLIRGTLALREILEFQVNLSFIANFYLLNAFQLFSFVLPLSAQLSLLFMFQKLKEEREFLALFSLGYNLKDFFKPLSIFILLITFFTFVSHFYILPKSKRVQKERLIKIYEESLSSPIPSKTPTAITERLYIYTRESQTQDSTNYLKKVIILEQKANQEIGIYLGDEGSFNKKGGFLFLKNGWIFHLDNFKNLEIFEFKEYLVNFSKEYIKKEKYYIKRGEMTWQELKNQLKVLSPSSVKYFRLRTEYYQRALYSIIVIPLLLQGFLLALFLKSHNRMLIFLLGTACYFLIYLSYNFLLSLGEAGKISPPFGHIIFFIILMLLNQIAYIVLIRKRGISF